MTSQTNERPGHAEFQMAENQNVLIAVLTEDQDDVELVNSTLRDGGHPVHCHWVKCDEDFNQVLGDNQIELIILNCDKYKDAVRQVV